MVEVVSKSSGRSVIALAGVVALLLATSVCAAGLKDAPALKDLLGGDFSGAKLVAKKDDGLVRVDLATGAVRQLAGFAGKYPDISRPCWSPDGRQILCSYGGKAYVMSEDGSDGRQVLTDTANVHEPIWWQDPGTGELCIVYKDADGKHWYGKGKQGSTWLYRPGGKTVRLADFPCDGGLSRDGTHLGEAYGGCLIVDLPRKKYHVLYGGKQSCNASVSPDDTYRLMHLYLPHDKFGIRNKFDKELWSISKPSGSQEWQVPRWSNHPDFCTATAKYGGEYKPCVIRIRDKKIVALRSLSGNWGPSHLWLPSGASAAVGSPGPIDHLDLKRLGRYKDVLARASCYSPVIDELRALADPEAGLIVRELEKHGLSLLEAAGRAEDARNADATYRQVQALFAGHDLARRAAEAQADSAFQRELAAAPKLARMAELGERLRPVGRRPVFDDPDFLERNRGALLEMVELARTLRTDFAETKAAVRADELARKYALPDRAERPAYERLVLTATIEAVSKVPDPADLLYPDLVTYVRYRVEKVEIGRYEGERIVVVHWGFRDRRLSPAASYKPGTRHRLTLDRFDAHPDLATTNAATEADDPDLVPYWAISVVAAR